MSDLLQVTISMVGVHPAEHLRDYPLLPGDVLTLAEDGTYTKHTGLCVVGFTLSDEQAATLQPVACARELTRIPRHVRRAGRRARTRLRDRPDDA
jgi:hypothetical protein